MKLLIVLYCGNISLSLQGVSDQPCIGRIYDRWDSRQIWMLITMAALRTTKSGNSKQCVLHVCLEFDVPSQNYPFKLGQI